jgi:CHASE2 domain-containing sensor protein
MPSQVSAILARSATCVWLAVATSMLVMACRAKAGDQPPELPFVAVFIDTKTEKTLGPFPYDRAVLAEAIEKAVESQARGVVLKFFIDKPKTADGDRALADAAKRTKLLVQARLDDSEQNPNLLPDRFTLNAQAEGKLLSGQSGWIPLPELSAAAYDVGFVDFRVVDRMPVVERYRDKLVKSLYLSCLELALGARAQIVPAHSVRIGDKTLELDEHSEIGIEYPAKDDLSYISFVDFIEQPARPELKDRIVIIAYDSERFEPVKTPAGAIRPHRAFIYALMSMYRKFR